MWDFPAKKIGKVFYSEVQKSWNDKRESYRVKMIVEVYPEQYVKMLPEGEVLTSGYWEVSFERGTRVANKHNKVSDKSIYVNQLTETGYLEKKGLKADLLSYQFPPSASW